MPISASDREQGRRVETPTDIHGRLASCDGVTFIAACRGRSATSADVGIEDRAGCGGGGFDLQLRNTSTGSRIIRGPRAVGAPSFLSDIDWRVYQGGKLLDLCAFVDYVTDVRTIELGQAISAYFDDRFVRKIYCLEDGSYELEVRCRQPGSCREVRALFGKRSGEK